MAVSAFIPVFSFLAVCGLIPAARRAALVTGFVDHPGGRKRHEEAVPPIGGLIVFPVFMVLALSFFYSTDLAWLCAGLLLLLAVGALDDRRQLPPRIKFAAQIVAALITVGPGGAYVEGLGDLFGFGPLWLGWGGYIFAAVATVLLVNAVNLMDGLDGLAGGLGFIVLLWLMLCGAGGAAGILAAGLAGFLVYNLRRPGRAKASVFLGDSGSLALGLSLAWFCIRASQGPGAAVEPVTVAWLLALPIFDTCGQFARRVREGRHPFDPDHDHFHHHFLAAGFTPGQATAAILCLSFIVGAIGVFAPSYIHGYVLGYAWTAMLFAHILLSMRPERFRHLIARLSGRRFAP